MRNDGVGGIQYIAVRTVVFFQLNDVLYLKIFFKVAHVAHARAAKAVNGLVVVAHGKHAIVWAGQ